MTGKVAYTVFRTKWGYFGLVGTRSGLLRSSLPVSAEAKATAALLEGLAGARLEKVFHETLQQQIQAYFEGECVDFGRDIPLLLDGFSWFAQQVLRTCRNIRYGRTVSYGRLARMAGRANAARAVGRVMANNPIPLIIPCHRIIRTDGQPGGFSATGGVVLKKRMLAMERTCDLQPTKRIV
jgi:methylated-DNA-[protein]-cysteine S-methyltransferase